MKKSLRITTFFLRIAMRYFLITFAVTVLLTEFLFANKSSGQQLQSTEVTLSASRKTIAQIINEIEVKTKLKFVYNPEELTDDIIFTNTRFKKEKVLDVLNKLGYTGIEEGEHIVLRKLDQLKTIVTGTVTDMAGLPLPGVSISIKNTQRGVITNADGQYSIEVGENEILVFNMIGFEKQEVTVNGQKKIDLILKESQTDLNEVVVVGYGTQKKGEVSSAISSIKPEDFIQGGVKSPMDLIRGKVPGLTITRTGGNNNPNAGSAIQLRGANSLAAYTGPLIIIDDIPGGDLSVIQQDDIASFDILKDGSAAAIYGTRANAGVIIITTKKGKAGEARFDYSTYFARDQVSRRPDVLNADEYRALKISDPTVNRVDYGSSVDYYDLLLDKNNLTQYHNLAASGGTSKTNYRASIYYSDQNGIAINNSNEYYGGRLNINHRGLKDKLNMQANVASRFYTSNNIGGNGADFEQAVQHNPTAPLFDSEGLFNDVFNDAYYYNPVARIYQETETSTRQNFSGDVKFTLDIYKGLKASAFGAVVRTNHLEEGYIPRAARNSVRNNGGGGYASKSNGLGITRTFESALDYSRLFLDKHTVSTVVGYSYQDVSANNFNAANTGFISDALTDDNLAAGGTVIGTGKGAVGSGSSFNTLIAFFGRVNYNYKSKYIASFILRHEGSSRFGKNNKWGNFPAVSAAWNLAEEPFIKNIKAINNLKLRIGYGVTGNQNIGNYMSITTLGTGGTYLNNGTWYQTYGPNKNPNPDLKWETKKEINIGTDFSFLDNRLSGSIDVYKRKTEDLLGNYTTQVPAYVTNSMLTNVGSIENKGVEVALSGIAVKKKAFGWNIDFTANSQKNKLLSISNDVFKGVPLTFGTLTAPGSLGPTIRTEEGGPLGNFYGKRFAGFTDAGKFLFYKADGSTSESGGMTNDDMAVIGNGVPQYMASLTNSFSYKNFDLSFFLRGKFDFDILNLQDLYYANPTVPNNLLKSAITKHAQIRESIQYSDYYIEKGDFVKLDNITLGYNVKLKTSYIRNLRVYGSCQNIATFTKYSGLDPEVQDTGLTTGIDNRTFYPYTRTFTLGLNVGF